MECTACPVCDSSELSHVSTYTTAAAARHFCPPQQSEERHARMHDSLTRLWPSGVCRVLRCRECGFGFALPLTGGDEEFYSILHEHSAYPAWRWDYDVALRAVNDSGMAAGNALDIGAGKGAFLRGLPSNWTGFAVESTPVAVKALESDGIRAWQDIAEASRAIGSFDLVTLFQTLEHVSDFNGVIGQASAALNPGGILVITVPDADAMFRQESVLGCADMPPNHVVKWTPAALTHVLRKNGLQVRETVRQPRTVRNIRGKLHLKLIANAAHNRSLASIAYGIRWRPARVAALAALTPATLVSLVPHLAYLLEGGAFGMVAHKLA